MSECLSCLSNSGEKRISPAATIYEGDYWLVEHTNPTGLLGWVVIVLKRHSEKLHELTRDEWLELSEVNFRLTAALHNIIETEKEYSCCFADMEGFRHIHFHMIPKTGNFNEHFTGSKVFNYLRVPENEAISREEIINLCNKLSREMSKKWE